jgi:Mrp family chromosome partitioning ATPase
MAWTIIWSAWSPGDLRAEQYRALRHIVEQLHKAHDLRVVAVSSPGVSDGKSYGDQSGRRAGAVPDRVLLIDADLRRPAMDNLLALGVVGWPRHGQRDPRSQPHSGAGCPAAPAIQPLGDPSRAGATEPLRSAQVAAARRTTR